MRLLNRVYLVALVLPILLLLFIPALRFPASRLVTGSNIAMVDLPMTLSTSRAYWSDSAILEKSPASLDAQMWALCSGNFPPGFEKFNSTIGNTWRTNNMRALAQLSKLHPENASLLVRALNAAPRENGRVAGPWEDQWDAAAIESIAASSALFSQSTKKELIGAHSYLPMFPLTDVEAEVGLELARRGQKLEPDNTFFDWKAAHFLFASRRDDEAIQTLLRASRKSEFEVHWQEFARGNFQVFDAVHPLLTEEKRNLFRVVPVSREKTMLHTCQLALWYAMQQEDKGNVARALDIEGALLRLGTVACRNAFFNFEGKDAVRLISTTWSAPEKMKWARVLNRGRVEPREQIPDLSMMLESARHFKTYATSHGRKDLAEETTKFEAQVQDFLAQSKARKTRDSFSDRWRGESFAKIALGWWLANMALWQALLALILWIGLVLVGPLKPPRGQKVTHLENRAVFYPLALGIGVSLTALLVGARFLWGDWMSHTYDSPYPFSQNPSYVPFFVWLALAAPFTVGFLSCTVATVQLFKRAPTHVPPYQMSPRDLGISPEMDHLLALFWRVQSFLWFRALPLITALFFLHYLAVYLPTSHFKPLSPNGFVNWAFPSALTLYILALVARLRFGLPAPKRAVLFVSTFALRRIVAWTIPFSLWLMVAALASGYPHRIILDKEVESWLNFKHPTKTIP